MSKAGEGSYKPGSGGGRPTKNPDIREMQQQKYLGKVEARKFLDDIKDCEDDAQKALVFTQAVAVIGNRVNINDPASVWNGFMTYSELCSFMKYPLENLGAYLSMGITKKTAEEWKSGKGKGERQEYRTMIERVDGICGTYRNVLALTGNLAPSLAIWRDKNFDAMSDNPIFTDETPQDNTETLSPQAIADKYKDILD